MVLKSSIHTLALPRQQRSHWDQRVTQDAYFSLLTHTKQLFLVKFCDTTAGNSVSFRTHRRTNAGWTDKRGSRNSYLDEHPNEHCLYNIISKNDAANTATLESRIKVQHVY